MPLTNLVDTLLNILVFTFIGILVWLYFRKESDDHKAGSQDSDGES